MPMFECFSCGQTVVRLKKDLEREESRFDNLIKSTKDELEKLKLEVSRKLLESDEVAQRLDYLKVSIICNIF